MPHPKDRIKKKVPTSVLHLTRCFPLISIKIAAHSLNANYTLAPPKWAWTQYRQKLQRAVSPRGDYPGAEPLWTRVQLAGTTGWRRRELTVLRCFMLQEALQRRVKATKFINIHVNTSWLSLYCDDKYNNNDNRLGTMYFDSHPAEISLKIHFFPPTHQTP